MTLAELITDLKASGANDNTLRLAMNCYALGTAEEREACAKVADAISNKYAFGYYGQEVDTADEIAAAIRARGKQ